MRIRVHITEHHISHAEMNSTGKDPVALALKSALTFRGYRVAQPSFHLSQIEILQTTGTAFVEYASRNRPVPGIHHFYRFDLPDEVSEFLRKFDAGEEVQPIAFTLDLKEEEEEEADAQ